MVFCIRLLIVLWCSAKTRKINLLVHYVLCLLRSEAEMYKIRDGHRVIYVCMGGGEGRARFLGLGPDFFSKRTTVADFFLIFQYKTLNSVQE